MTPEATPTEGLTIWTTCLTCCFAKALEFDNKFEFYWIEDYASLPRRDESALEPKPEEVKDEPLVRP